MRRILSFLLIAGCCQAVDIPPWWKALSSARKLESRFVQESQSEVFGSLKKEGLLQLGGRGRLRVAYTKGLLILSDGQNLIQYDAMARTAQRMEIQSAIKDMPLLNLLVNPAALETAYSIRVETGNRIQLEPKRKELPKVTVDGQNGLLKRVSWIDGTGAKQSLELLDPHTPKSSFPPSTFIFTAPPGTRWIE